MASETAGGETRTEIFFNYICPFTPVLSLVFSLALLFALASVLFAAALPTDSASFTVALLTIPIDGVVLLVTGYLLHVCNRTRT